ncbi:hypothetical protein BRC97_09925 [Halobacteriales archaeon QS_6_71_20]|nr:MAG: hypothetical protein BRC97_09925 [Halobacteriales archaeon QS_6_71_20]
MTTDIDTTDYTDADLRERFPEIVVTTSGKSSKVLHVPDGDDVEPLCDVTLVSKEWTRKSVEVYPGPDYYDYCDRCREKVREEDLSGITPSPDDGYGNALEAEWAEG